MRILYLADIRFPLERANGIQSLRTCHALASRGHDVSLGVRPDTHRPPRDPFAFYGIAHNDRLAIFRSLARGPESIRRIEYLAFAVRAARRGDYDAIFTRDLTVASVLLRLRRTARPFLIYESHGFAPVFAATMNELQSGAQAATEHKERRLVARERRVWRLADGYVTTTRVLAHELTERFGPRPHVATIPNGTDVPSSGSVAFASPGAVPVVAYAGHMYPWKGVDLFLQALAELPEVRASIAGGHPREADLSRVQALADRLKITERVTFTGQIEPSRVPAFLASANVLVLPTIATASARYTSPLKLFEYMAACRPIVASDLAPIREVVQDGVTACLVPAGNASALADGIRRVISNPKLAERLATAAFEAVPAYSWEIRAGQIERLIEDVRGL